MKLLDITCPHCGAAMKVTDNAKTVHCEYCNHDFIIDDEVIHTAHRIENAEQLGYDLEAGRRRYSREQEELKNRLHSGLCPHCGALVYVDTAHITETCYECHKEFNVEAAVLFERAHISSQFGNSATDVLDYYDRALKLQSDGARLIERRKEFRGYSFWGWLIGGIVMFAVLSFFVESTAIVVIGFVAFLFALFVFRKDTTSQEIRQKKGEPLSHTGSANANNYVSVVDDDDNFPESDMSFPGMVPDSHTCLAHAAEYEDLAVRARAHGLNDLADRYDEAATHWHNLYEEAEDEEMEW